VFISGGLERSNAEGACLRPRHRSVKPLFCKKSLPPNGVNSRLANRLAKYGRLGDDGFDDVSLVLNARQPGIQTLETIRKPFGINA